MAGRDAISEGDYESSGKHEHNHPSPIDIEVFIPWACGQLQMPFIPIINRITFSAPARYTSKSGKGKDEATTVDSQSGSNAMAGIGLSGTSNTDLVIYIDAVYDNSDNLIQLKFNRNLNVPVILLKLFSLIAHFHPRLTAIHINKGLNQDGLYQVNKIVKAAKITEAILDNTILVEANYYILLDNNCPLKYLSLARCKLNDSAIKMITSKLNYPSKASKTLSVLNLSSNRITDEGAKYLGDMLRMNRQLTYLNLSGNMISDIGADSILSILMAFPVTADEVSQKKAKKIIYMQEKNNFIRDAVEHMRIDYENRYAARKKSNKPVPFATKKVKAIEVSPDSDRGSISGMESVWLEKAEATAEEIFGPFEDAFNSDNTIARSGTLYCYGNNVLCYLNLAYNNLTYFSIQKLLQVINVQREWRRRPRGLINVCIEGNNLPEACEELEKIDNLIDIGLVRFSNMSTTIKKKNMIRTK